MQITSDEHIVVEHRGSAGIIRLSRARAINSLTIGMVRAISSALDAFEHDPAVATVVILGEGDRGFCAGGDIRALYESGRAGTPDAQIFWREEFALTLRIARYPKPYIAFMDGVTMGGGVGISTHGRHRIVTERTRLAMPETGIGYFPDVGASWFLPRMPGETGTWIGLTGADVNSADAIFTGFADIQIQSDRLPELLTEMAELSLSTGSGACDTLFKKYRSEVPQGPVEQNRALIDRVFGFNSVEEIFSALADEPGEFAAQTHSVLSTRSPTSLKLALRLIREGAKSASLSQCLDRELNACREVLRTPDFYEGIRAAIIDKDRTPRWSPGRIDDVTLDMIEPFFSSTEHVKQMI
ncbi:MULTISPECIES: enoyl-CoA hydratase/isomerase family protein [Rhizobium]|uniref:3-hydroxyisobutyryl-CoA hydrolase n=1 Tax=Rhizobium leguminosarum bv. viciae TaxID=387 RepID=A0A8G2ISR9_RHILV|nr:enoyl-CoA hydratase/isomerase family protein [Rhizobium leguminosarum]NEI02877.1 enoyl-CoA hydratase/isomerase family protein [Rhizobium leguminosarum]NKK10901.1 enoyl-CoA hydratase/isomerase family protein [Rhizobium leguminosarum bv. viciae]NKK24367.1 enoyl-CoA hydratase/isomerase family protein [Rhizobium leguminosarum bv. viciae]TBX84805.1 enoyl-CoA hydratase/isomerase family protein [Rhizobium leguminosarum bv. viciae]TBZ11654.1 enoyl-CoA hydratase/isomerase family protein [Rhizobium l